MKTRELAAEMRRATAAINSDDRRMFRDLGISDLEIDVFQMIGRCLVRVRGGLYEPDDEGRSAYLTPLLTHFPHAPESTEPEIFVRFGNIVDLLAWHPRNPDRWALRVGAGEWLGSIEPQYCEPDPVPVWRCPLTWFQSGCRGLVPLSREQSSVYRLLSCCIGGIIAEDFLHQREIEQILAKPYPVPAVRARNDREFEHAA